MSIDPMIQKPTMLLDRRRAVANITRLVSQAKKGQVRFRPHFKTHQSAIIGGWFRDQGVTAITVSSVGMASYFAEHGWDDITIAFPLNMRQLPDISNLAQRVRLGVLLESTQVAGQLSSNLTDSVDVWLKVDTGSHRTGIPWQDPSRLVETARAVHGLHHLRWRGILTHDSLSYQARSPQQILAAFDQSVTRMQRAQAILAEAGLHAEISVGDTPGCTLAQDFAGIDEMRPGNFVFYDLMQWQIGACSLSDIAVAVACTVVALHPGRDQVVIYGGAIHLSKERMEWEGQTIYGAVARFNGDGWGELLPRVYVTGLSQEHGMVTGPSGWVEGVREGDLLLVLPVHSCLTANLLQRYLTLDKQWIPMAGVL